jgi:hypothetical protein
MTKRRESVPSQPSRVVQTIEAGLEIMKTTLRIIDPDDSLQVASTALAQTEQRAGELEIERAAKIEQAEGDYLADVAKIDRELTNLRANAVVHRDRVDAMQVRRRRHDRARLEQEKTAGIAEVQKRLGARLDAARKLDTALVAVGHAFAELLKAEDDAFGNFPRSVSPLGSLGHFRLDGIEALSSHRVRRPPSTGLVRCIAEHEPFDFAGVIETKNREAIEMLESAPVAEDAAA